MCRYPTSRALVTAGIDSSFETRQTPNPSWGIWTPLLSVVIGLSATDRSFVRGQYVTDTTSAGSRPENRHCGGDDPHDVDSRVVGQAGHPPRLSIRTS